MCTQPITHPIQVIQSHICYTHRTTYQMQVVSRPSYSLCIEVLCTIYRLRYCKCVQSYSSIIQYSSSKSLVTYWTCLSVYSAVQNCITVLRDMYSMYRNVVYSMYWSHSTTSQASRDPSSRKGQVKSNTLTCLREMQLCDVECNYCATLCLACGRKYAPRLATLT